MPLSDERILAGWRAWCEGFGGIPAKLLAAYDEQRAEVERLREQVAAVDAVARDLARPFADGVPDREGAHIAAQIRAALASADEGGDHAAE